MRFRIAIAVNSFLVAAGVVVAGEFTPQELEFFEAEIRPLLVDHCYVCHSTQAKAIKAGLRLDDPSALRQGGDSGAAVVPGNADDSLLIQAVRYESYEMPPDGKLKPRQIAALERWVTLGLPWPDAPRAVPPPSTGYDWEVVRGEHWAWQPVRERQPPPPAVGDRIRNPIDQFVAARLRDAGLRQAPTATPAEFVRRVFLDLTGLPPAPAEVAAWTLRLDTATADGTVALNDQAVAELIDYLLASPAYGERWGRHWLDVARYNDGFGGFLDNQGLPNAWRFRDWVVAAYNRDLPYDEFVRSQIAGDQLAAANGDPSLAVATGFFAVGPTYRSDGGDPDSVAQAKGETLDDRVDTLSRAFLGLTVSCARCHDHKFDPIPTQDYYSLAGVFNNTASFELPLANPDVVEAYQTHQEHLKLLQEQAKKLRQQAGRDQRELTDEEQARLEGWQREIKSLQANAPKKYATAHAIRDAGAEDMHVALRGNLLKPGELAPRRFLRILAGERRDPFAQGSGRGQLADAIADAKNPLTARVMVNRIWQHHFGKALVRTPSNFGTLGEFPTHPALLDWLTLRFLESGWSIKSMHRLILRSATYQSSSRFREAAFARDGDNRQIWRMNPRRMDVETWRDALLAVTGELDRTIGGPPIDDITLSKRRTIYAKVSRNGDVFRSDQFLQIFDFPVPRATHAQRTTSVVPQQFLFMMNSPFMVGRAKALAARIAGEYQQLGARIERAYRLLYGRLPTAEELAIGRAYLSEQADSRSGLDTWQQYCQVLLSSNEFMYIR